MNSERRSIAIVGNPNCGKTTLFNGLTGLNQRVGNWPGVTVERKEGVLRLGGERVPFVDLPGIYGLLATSEDERIARDYILSGEPALIVDIVDATNLERNLFLTTQLIDLGVPVLVVLNMIDLAQAQGMSIDVDAISKGLGCPVIAVAATNRRDVARAARAIEEAWAKRVPPQITVPQPRAVEDFAARWREPFARTIQGLLAQGLRAAPRWLALKVLERDGWALNRAAEFEADKANRLHDEIAELETELGESADVILAEARYAFIESVTAKSLSRMSAKRSLSDRIDGVVLNRFAGIPVFLAVMYLLFGFSVLLGGAFIDFFDLLGGTVLVDGFGRLLAAVGSPDWLVTILADGVGAGLQTVLTFVPVIFAMFFGLTLLEDSGYMARAAFVMDRFMRWVGLPGKSFVPMLVGFGCNVPAILATRTLENKRDRYLTIFMNPLMSCGARLPVYALFAVAFFGAAAGAVTFSLYLVGIVVAIFTGLFLKATLFKGEPSYFVMELPPYHQPRFGVVAYHSWRRLVLFLTRAKYIVPIVAILAVLNAVGTDGTLGHEDTSQSVLSSVGRTITPVFEPMGIEKDNWPATVGLFTGILAKETVVGTLNSLYSQEGAGAVEQSEDFSFWAGIKEALQTVPDNLRQVPASLVDPLGLGVLGGSSDEVAEEVGAATSVYAGLRAGFTEGRPQVYAYLLFVLLYLPCVAAFAAMTREMGLRYAGLAVAYLTVTSWSAATLFYQISVERSPLWIGVALAALALLAGWFWALGRRLRRPIKVRSEELEAPGGLRVHEV